MLAITKRQTSLEYVALRKLHCLTDKGLDNINSAFLKEVDLRWNEKISDRGMNEVYSHNSSLIMTAGIFTIVSNNLNLRYVHLVNCHGLTGQSVIYVAQNLADKLVSHQHASRLTTEPSRLALEGSVGHRRIQIIGRECICTFG